MLVELSMVEQRYLAVREVLDSAATVTDVAARYGVSRKTFTDGLLDMPTKEWAHWRTEPADRIAVPIRSRRRLRPASSQCEKPIPAGARERFSAN